MRLGRVIALIITGYLVARATVLAQVPYPVGHMPDAYYQKLRSKPSSFQFSHAFLKTVGRIQINRQLAASPNFTSPAQLVGGLSVSGTKTIIVIPIEFADSGQEPYPASQLTKELFGSWPTGTMTQFYKENSYDKLEVEGSVVPWKRVPGKVTQYAGPDYTDEDGVNQHCYGLCNQSKIGELLTAALDAHPEVDWGPTDNDGPDGIPNSGDDDGFVDFVAFVHAGKGGECGDNQNIWSHRGKLSDWLGHEYTTKTPKHGGGFLKIDDYVIMPALACDGSTMIQIGVFAHEFGHAFGLPDLYDTSRKPQWNGLGNWDLMAAGGWGGDDQSPEYPTHMSAWSKAFLGWVTPVEIDSDSLNMKLGDWETTPTLYLLRISATQYYLITNRQPKSFDLKLPGGGGLLVEYVNDRKVQAGLASNTVNNDVNNKGVAIVEADGIAHLLDMHAARSNAGDVFPGSGGVSHFDSASPSKPLGANAICTITKDLNSSTITVSVQKSTALCAVKSSASSNTQPMSIPIAALAKSPSQFTNRTVRVTGNLSEEGTNYFIDAVPVLMDESGNRLYVEIPISLEVENSRATEHPPPRPAVLTDLLGKRVELSGELVMRDLRRKGNVLVLQVHEARILDE